MSAKPLVGIPLGMSAPGHFFKVWFDYLHNLLCLGQCRSPDLTGGGKRREKRGEEGSFIALMHCGASIRTDRVDILGSGVSNRGLEMGKDSRQE